MDRGRFLPPLHLREGLFLGKTKLKSMTGNRFFSWVFLLLLAVSACKRTDVRPAPPAGSFVFGNELNQSGYDLLETNEGGFVLLGGSQHPEDGDYDIYLVKTDRSGGLEWERTFRRDFSSEVGMAIRPYGNGYALLGFRSADGGGGGYGNFVLLMLDGNFNQTWERVIPGANISSGYNQPLMGFFVLDNGNCLLVYSNGYESTRVLLDPNGTVLEQVVLASSSGYYYSEITAQMVPLADGFLAAYVVNDVSYQPKVELSFLDADGREDFSSLVDVDDPYGSLMGYGQRPDSSIFLLMDNSGNLVLYELPDALGGQNTVREDLGSSFSCRSVQVLADGSALLAGHSGNSYDPGTRKDAVLRRLEIDNQLSEIGSWGGTGSDLFRKVLRSSDGRTVLLGQTQSYGAGGTDLFLTIN